MNEYEKQANKFLEETNTEFKAEFLKHGKHFNDDDNEGRDIYKITLKRGEREYSFNFGQSINCSGKWTIFGSAGSFKTNDDKKAGHYSGTHKKMNKNFKEPSAYDVLACLQKYDVGTFEDFCGCFGYDNDSIKANKSYKAVLEEYENLKMLYSNTELEKMREIN